MIAWIASRTLQRGKLKAFRKAWQFKVRPQGLVAVFFLHGAKANEMISLSLWRSSAALRQYRRSAVERERLASMNPLVRRVNWAGIYKAEKVLLR